MKRLLKAMLNAALPILVVIGIPEWGAPEDLVFIIKLGKRV